VTPSVLLSLARDSGTPCKTELPSTPKIKVQSSITNTHSETGHWGPNDFFTTILCFISHSFFWQRTFNASTAFATGTAAERHNNVTCLLLRTCTAAAPFKSSFNTPFGSHHFNMPIHFSLSSALQELLPPVI
jgi:hypothetical protein